RVFQLLRDPRLHDGLGRNLDRLASCRVPAHARLALLDDQLDHAGQNEFALALQLFFGQRCELVEELTSLSALHFEALSEVRKEFGFAHPPGVRHRGPLTGRAGFAPQLVARATTIAVLLGKTPYPSALISPVSIRGILGFGPVSARISHRGGEAPVDL